MHECWQLLTQNGELLWLWYIIGVLLVIALITGIINKMSTLILLLLVGVICLVIFGVISVQDVQKFKEGIPMNEIRTHLATD